jgi:nucleoside-diphosphate-sugar epimerase
MQVFVTGASGFVGGATTRALIAKGHKVAAMSRSERSDKAIEAMGAKPVRCDLETLGAAHLKGCKVVVHCAAYVEAWGPRDAWYNANVLGTQRVLDASSASSILAPKRLSFMDRTSTMLMRPTLSRPILPTPIVRPRRRRKCACVLPMNQAPLKPLSCVRA